LECGATASSLPKKLIAKHQRPPDSDTAHRNEQSVDEKESGRWIRALQAAGERARQTLQTQLVVCGDRESDIYELFDQKQAAPPNVHLLVRGQHDRCLTGQSRLRETLARLPAGGTARDELAWQNSTWNGGRNFRFLAANFLGKDEAPAPLSSARPTAGR